MTGYYLLIEQRPSCWRRTWTFVGETETVLYTFMDGTPHLYFSFDDAKSAARQLMRRDRRIMQVDVVMFQGSIVPSPEFIWKQ